MSEHKCLFIVGPTATGKSDLAFEIAKEFSLPVMNGDSVQVYLGLEIGSAQPPRWQKDEVEHQLFDFVKPGENLTAGDYRKKALEQLAENAKAGHSATVIVGGSGFYIRALIEGMFEIAKVSEEVRQAVRSISLEQAVIELEKVDPVTARKLSSNDEYRIQRALEVYRSEGRPLSEIESEFARQKQDFPYKYKMIGLNQEREKMRDRVSNRAQKMVDQGLLKEVQGLLDAGFTDWKALSSVGYKEAVECLIGELSESELVEKITLSTMKLIKKQSTFFRGQFEVEWFEVGISIDQVRPHIEELFRA